MAISKAIYLGNESCLSSAMGEGEAEGVLILDFETSMMNTKRQAPKDRPPKTGLKAFFS